MTRRPSAVIFAAAGLAWLAGCAGPQPAAEPGGVLRVVIGTDVTSLDPHVPFDDVSSGVILNVFDRLVRLDETLRVEPDLALRWINPDDNTWRFFLDDTARFSDGSRVSAGDVVASIERARSLADSDAAAFTRLIDRVEAVDEATVDVHTRQPVAILNDLVFLPIASAASVSRASTPAEQLVGSGPYRLVERAPGRRIVLDANPHHRHTPAATRIEIEIVPGAELVQTVRRNPPDLALFLRVDAQRDLDAAPPAATRIVSTPGTFVVYVQLDVRETLADGSPNPFADVRVRRALSLALDREALARDTMGRFARAASQIVAPQVFGFDPSLPPGVADPEAARRLLGEAGLAGDIVVDASELGSHRIESALVDQWRAAGIPARLQVHADPEYQDLVGSGRGVSVRGWGCTGGDAGEALSFLLHRHDPAGGWGVANVVGFADPELDRLVESSLGIVEPPARLAVLQAGVRLAAERLPYIPLLARDDVALVADRVEWTPRVDGELRLDEIAFRR